MSGTRSPFRTAPATERAALIVAHGSPSDPWTQERALERLAARVADCLPGWEVRGTTLAAPGRFEAVCAAMQRPVLTPFFMAGGWFTTRALPRRAAPFDVMQLEPFGHHPTLPAVAAARIARCVSPAALPDCQILIAAHGSRTARGSAEATERFAASLARLLPCAAPRTAFLEEAPFVADVARGMQGPAICLPLFALSSTHVTDDLPRALGQAGFAGTVLPPLIDWPEVPGLLAEAIARTKELLPCP